MKQFDVDLDPSSLAQRLSGRRRVLFVGSPGSGKSTLAAQIAAVLLSGFVQSAGIDAILALQGGGESPALEEELRAFRLFVVRVRPAPEARRPGKGARNCRRTELWNKYLEQSSEYGLI